MTSCRKAVPFAVYEPTQPEGKTDRLDYRSGRGLDGHIDREVVIGHDGIMRCGDEESKALAALTGYRARRLAPASPHLAPPT